MKQWFFFQASQMCRLNVDYQLYLFKEGKAKSNQEMAFIGRSPLTRGYLSSWEGSLMPGNYLIVPHNSSCVLKRRSKALRIEEVQLVSAWIIFKAMWQNF